MSCWRNIPCPTFRHVFSRAPFLVSQRFLLSNLARLLRLTRSLLRLMSLQRIIPLYSSLNNQPQRIKRPQFIHSEVPCPFAGPAFGLGLGARHATYITHALLVDSYTAVTRALLVDSYKVVTHALLVDSYTAVTDVIGFRVQGLGFVLVSSYVYQEFVLLLIIL